MIRLLLALVLALPLAGSEAADAWAAGRPAEALPALHATALASGRWDAWLDLGLAAADAGRRGPAVAWLIEAHRRAPQRPEPRRALASLGADLPEGWVRRLAPATWPGSGPLALPLAVLAGIAWGWALGWRHGRRHALVVGGVALALLLPGALATWLDGRRGWAAVTADSTLLDASGRAVRPLPAGSLIEREAAAPWAGHVAVRLADGTSGWLAETDLVATP